MKYSRRYIIKALTGFFLVLLNLTGSANSDPQYAAGLNDTVRVKLLIDTAKQHFYFDLKKTQEYALKVLELSEKSGYIRGISLGNFYLAQVYLDYNSQLAGSFLIESLKHAKNISDSVLINSINNSFGILYQNANDHEMALKYFHKVLNSYLVNGNDSLAAAMYNNLGISYEELQYDSLAMDNYLLATQINEQNGNLEWLAKNYQNLGNYYLKHNQTLEAGRYLTKSLDIAKRNNNESIKPYIYYNLYEFSLLENNSTNAMKFARLSLQKSREQMVILKERDALIAIIALHERNKRTDSAFFYQKVLLTVADSISNSSRIDQLYALDLQNKLEEQRLANEMELKIIKIEKSRKELIYIIIILLSLLSVTALSLLARWQRDRLKLKNAQHKSAIQEKGKLENQLDYKNKEFTTQLIFFQKRNEYLNHLAKKLGRIVKNAGGLTEKQLRGVIKDINKNTEQDIWPEFEIRFKETHADFYKNLTTRFPNLTPNELKLCAFLKLNMSTKEISELTNQNPDSLKIARHRLRAKLGLSRPVNIVNFLNQM